MSLRLDKRLRSMLAEGERRTSLKTSELIRRTLRTHLSETIEREAKPLAPLTNVKPWRPGALAKSYKRIGNDWDRVEVAAAAAQGRPAFED